MAFLFGGPFIRMGARMGLIHQTTEDVMVPGFQHVRDIFPLGTVFRMEPAYGLVTDLPAYNDIVNHGLVAPLYDFGGPAQEILKRSFVLEPGPRPGTYRLSSMADRSRHLAVNPHNANVRVVSGDGPQTVFLFCRSPNHPAAKKAAGNPLLGRDTMPNGVDKHQKNRPFPVDSVMIVPLPRRGDGWCIALDMPPAQFGQSERQGGRLIGNCIRGNIAQINPNTGGTALFHLMPTGEPTQPFDPPEWLEKRMKKENKAKEKKDKKKNGAAAEVGAATAAGSAAISASGAGVSGASTGDRSVHLSDYEANLGGNPEDYLPLHLVGPKSQTLTVHRKLAQQMLTQEQLFNFAKDGFIVLPGVVPESMVNAARQVIDTHLQKCAAQGRDPYVMSNGPRPQKILGPNVQDSPEITGICSGTPVLAAAEFLFGEPAYPVWPPNQAQCAVTMPNSDEGAFGWHIDGMGLRDVPDENPFCLLVGISLSPQLDYENGPLCLLPGSHREVLDELRPRYDRTTTEDRCLQSRMLEQTMNAHERENEDVRRRHELMKAVRTVKDEHARRPGAITEGHRGREPRGSPIFLAPGDAALVHSRVIHRGSRCRTVGQPRYQVYFRLSPRNRPRRPEAQHDLFGEFQGISRQPFANALH
eukprot:Clim_evm42s148 gene=Clim_evmTU42s148